MGALCTSRISNDNTAAALHLCSERRTGCCCRHILWCQESIILRHDVNRQLFPICKDTDESPGAQLRHANLRDHPFVIIDGFTLTSASSNISAKVS